MRRRDRRFPLNAAVVDIHGNDLAVIEATQGKIAPEHGSGCAAQRQARDLLLLRPQLVAVRRCQAM